jgi:hypothetical protein
VAVFVSFFAAIVVALIVKVGHQQSSLQFLQSKWFAVAKYFGLSLALIVWHFDCFSDHLDGQQSLSLFFYSNVTLRSFVIHLRQKAPP